MAEPLSPSDPKIANTAPIIRATIDHLSAIRYIHAQSLRAATLRWADAKAAEAYVELVYAPAYSIDIERAINTGRCFGAMIDGRLVGTCGWSPAEEAGAAARIRWCHVLPIFTGLGLGRSLLSAVEAAAEDDGCWTFIARSSQQAVRFFEVSGYGITAHSTRMVGAHSLPVTYLRKSLRAPAGATLL